MSTNNTQLRPLKIIPINSFVESSFFTKLSDLKLNEFKLDSSRRSISCFMTNPKKLNKFNDRPIVNVDYTSFENNLEEDSSNIYFNGYIYNVNTVEEFKSINKQGLLKEWGSEIYEDITTKKDLTHQEINRCFILSFSDLKKYKFYYWFAFPALHSPWHVIDSDDDLVGKYGEIVKDYLHSSEYEQFFQISDGKIILLQNIDLYTEGTFVFIDSSLSADKIPSVHLKNYLYILAIKGFKLIDVIVYRIDTSSFHLKLGLDEENFQPDLLPKVTGWERTSQGKLGPKLADLGSLINPNQLAEQAVDLNLKLMKWRVAPDLDLDIIKDQRVLLLGAGTLGSYVARALMGWGVRNITFVDNGRISYSNPVRQPLFYFRDCFSDQGQGEVKAFKAAEALKEIFPGVNSKGYNLEVPMIGHPVSDEHKQNFDTLGKLFDENDAVFLLMDSRESRWLPTILGLAKDKIVINAALGYDSYLVMRHGNLGKNERLGCYYCNDVVAPSDSLSDRSLDQMCTVTRPGVALMAASLAVELLISILQHPDKQNALVSSSKFGDVPHQIRGFLHDFQQTRLQAPNYTYCSACSLPVLQNFKEQGWDFVKDCLNDSKYLEEVCGLAKLQKEAELASEELLRDLQFSDDDDEWLE